MFGGGGCVVFGWVWWNLKQCKSNSIFFFSFESFSAAKHGGLSLKKMQELRGKQVIMIVRFISGLWCSPFLGCFRIFHEQLEMFCWDGTAASWEKDTRKVAKWFLSICFGPYGKGGMGGSLEVEFLFIRLCRSSYSSFEPVGSCFCFVGLVCFVCFLCTWVVSPSH